MRPPRRVKGHVEVLISLVTLVVAMLMSMVMVMIIAQKLRAHDAHEQTEYSNRNRLLETDRNRL
ncbi:MAG: hypothetical protein AAFQ04_10445 [Pseudomonadota bacterium]